MDAKKDSTLVNIDVEHVEVAGPSTLPPVHTTLPPPPDFGASAKDQAFPPELTNIDFPVPFGGEDPPPDFAPYEAEYFVTSIGDIISHDEHLNEDALYRFLLSQSQTYPGFFLDIRGSHIEHHTRTVHSTDSQGHSHSRQEHYTETVVDFEFPINISQHIISGPIHWSVADEEPAYRGEMFKEVDGVFAPDESDIENGLEFRSRRKATKDEISSAKAWEKERKARGLPPWIGPGMSMESWSAAVSPEVDPSQTNVLKSSKSLRQWADEYCASKKHLKEFTYERCIYGWNISALEQAVAAAIRSTYYTGTYEVKFRRTGAHIYIRPDNHLSRTLSNKWLKFLLWITLIYIFIWLYKRFLGGGKWEVCGGAYALKRWQPASTDDNSDTLPPYTGPSWGTNGAVASDARHAPGMTLIGLREGEWFQQWEGTIKRAVSGRLRTDEPLLLPDDRPTGGVAYLLDGYRA
ncbi:unnamed protein product [Somion occarium]|uniref:Uncharacterized protein n=1 Tax=Somion occarium TaxID=3059160 RepID=A0ABP1CJ63_9APHY